MLLWAPWWALHGAPLTELSGDQDFQLFLQRNLEFTRKIRGDVAALQRLVVSPARCRGGMAATARSQIRGPPPCPYQHRRARSQQCPLHCPRLSPGVLGHPPGTCDPPGYTTATPPSPQHRLHSRVPQPRDGMLGVLGVSGSSGILTLSPLSTV